MTAELKLLINLAIASGIGWGLAIGLAVALWVSLRYRRASAPLPSLGAALAADESMPPANVRAGAFGNRKDMQ